MFILVQGLWASSHPDQSTTKLSSCGAWAVAGITAITLVLAKHDPNNEKGNFTSYLLISLISSF